MGIFDRKNHFNVDGKVRQTCIPADANADTGQTVVVTGGSQGMGRALARMLAQKGAHVAIVARNEAKLAEAFKYIAVSASTADIYVVALIGI